MAELSYSKKLTGILASFSVIVLLGMNLIMTMKIDVGTMIFAFTKVLPVAFVMGYLGHLIGNILDNPRRGRKK